MAQSELRIETLGTAFTIAADEDPAYLKDLLCRYLAAVEKTKRSTRLKDPLKLAILTGFLCCDELQKFQDSGRAEREAGSTESQEAQELTLRMIAWIDEVLEQDA